MLSEGHSPNNCFSITLRSNIVKNHGKGQEYVLILYLLSKKNLGDFRTSPRFRKSKRRSIAEKMAKLLGREDRGDPVSAGASQPYSTRVTKGSSGTLFQGPFLRPRYFTPAAKEHSQDYN